LRGHHVLDTRDTKSYKMHSVVESQCQHHSCWSQQLFL
jgi:hypothetical protein